MSTPVQVAHKQSSFSYPFSKYDTAVEADATYFNFSKTHKGHVGTYRKTPVIGAVERGGEIRAVVVGVASTRRSRVFS